MHGGLKLYRGSPAAARHYVEADRSRADDYYLAEGAGVAERYVASPIAAARHADTHMLRRITETLIDLGFTSEGVSAEGLQHRWIRDEGVLDVLLPEGVGERSRQRTGATGSPTLETPGGTQALQRSETVAVTVEGREGFVCRPNLVGALIVKAAAHTAPGDPAKRRHRLDFLTLAGLIAARDFADEDLSTQDHRRLRGMVAAIRADQAALLQIPGAATALDRLVVAARLS